MDPVDAPGITLVGPVVMRRAAWQHQQVAGTDDAAFAVGAILDSTTAFKTVDQQEVVMLLTPHFVPPCQLVVADPERIQLFTEWVCRQFGDHLPRQNEANAFRWQGPAGWGAHEIP